MTSKPQAYLYSSVPSAEPTPQPQPNYVVLPLYPHPRRRNIHRIIRHLRRNLLLALSLVLLSLSIFLLWPSDPELQLVRVRLNHVQVRTYPSISLSLSLSLTLRVRNRDLFSLNYDSLNVSIVYRGRELGFVESEGGSVRARGASYVDATLLLDGSEVLHDFFYLIEDIAAGSVPFDTLSRVKGDLVLFFFKIPIQAKVSCEVHINPMNQTIIQQNCYPE